MAQQGTRNTIIAGEGLPFLFGAVAVTVASWHFFGLAAAVLPGLIVASLYYVFRDPSRPVPAVPLGVVSPVDGEVVEVGVTDHAIVGGEAQTIRIRVDAFGTYTARCPAEGKVMDLAAENGKTGVRMSGGLWVRTDETDDVVLTFSGHRFGLAPRAFIRYGERVGQGQRCAFLRLTRFAEIQVPIVARMQVHAGQRVTAGSDVLAKLPHH